MWFTVLLIKWLAYKLRYRISARGSKSFIALQLAKQINRIRADPSDKTEAD